MTCAEQFEQLRLRKACAALRALWSLGDRYVTSQAPWATIKTDPSRAACVTRTAINLLRLIAVASAPVLPHTADLLSRCTGTGGPCAWPSNAGAILNAGGGQRVTVPDVLFPRLPPERVRAMETRFGA